MKLLIAEDEVKLNKGLAKGLRDMGFAVDSAFDGEEGEKMARLNDYDLIILDIMMPKKTGIEVCKNLRDSSKSVPILMLTAKDSVEDKITGLDIGADDYLTKPFSFDELVARIGAFLRRSPISTKDVLELGELRLDTRTQKISVGEITIDATLREYALLEYLLRNIGTALSRGDLLEHVWDVNYDSLSNVVDVQIKNLRKKLPKEYAKRIKTVWGKGYKLV